MILRFIMGVLVVIIGNVIYDFIKWRIYAEKKFNSSDLDLDFWFDD